MIDNTIEQDSNNSSTSYTSDECSKNKKESRQINCKIDVPLAYFFMPRYGKDLKSIMKSRDKHLSSASIFHLGLSLLNTIELIHSSGLVYNDLKPDNILMGYQ